MIAVAPNFARFVFLCLAGMVTPGSLLSAHAQQSPRAEKVNECSVSKTNTSCSITIDRSNPVAPPTVQMFSGQRLTVTVKNALPFERYFLDFASGQATATPDVAAAMVSALSANLGKLTNLLPSKMSLLSARSAHPDLRDLMMSECSSQSLVAKWSTSRRRDYCARQVSNMLGRSCDLWSGNLPQP